MGSPSYITTTNGSISQHVEYIAFGEVLFEEHSSSFYSPYLFNGKELDRETNLSYYGARYYDVKTSVWLNVDPLKEKMPNFGAYVFSFNNPIIFTDPDGRMAGPGDGLGPGVADGKADNGQQKKAGVWSITNKEGNFMWNNVKGEYVLNTSDRGGAENSFPGLGKVGTTYAGGDNPKNKRSSNRYDYSQPPQNIADFGGFLHDKAYDTDNLEGVDGVISPQSTKANRLLIDLSKQIQVMYKNKSIDPFTGAPVSKMTNDAAVNMVKAFEIIEIGK